jgi:hypothetical protein
MRYLSLFLLLLPFVCFAQFKLTGHVINQTNGKPIPDASVFINNTTNGAKAAADGSFTLTNLNPGQYDLIVSVIGYETYSKTIMVDENIAAGDIKMLPKIMMMKEVMIAGKDPTRARKLRLFKEHFLGRAIFWRECKIVNPDILKLTFTDHQQVLTASTDDFLEVENNALGYKLKYLLNAFRLDRNALNMAYEGLVLFEEQQGSAAEKEKWEKNRRKAYFGSPTHFLRQVLADRVDSNYMVRSFCIKKVDKEKITYDTLAPVKYVSKTDQKGIFALNYPTGIDIFYYAPGEKHIIHYYNMVEAGNRGQVANIQFVDPYLYFDSRGVILNQKGAVFNYEWSQRRVAELLPTDYWPLK